MHLDPSPRIWIDVGRDVVQPSAFFKFSMRFHHQAKTRCPQQCALCTGIATSRNSDSRGLGWGLCRRISNIFPDDSVTEIGRKPPTWTLSVMQLGVHKAYDVMSGLASLFLVRGKQGLETVREEKTSPLYPSRLSSCKLDKQKAQ